MNDNREPYYYEDVIDLRELVQTLLDYKWVILGVTLLAALTAFLVSSFVLPKRYRASAYVTLTEPTIRAELDSSIQVSPTFPDTGALAELSEAEAIMDQVSNELGLDIEEYNSMEWEASLQGQSQLRLQVTTIDPELSEKAANNWAKVMVFRLNNLYGSGDQTLRMLENEVQTAKERWKQAQDSLEDYLPQSDVEALEVQLAEQKNKLTSYLNKIKHNNLLMSDLLALKTQLEDFEENEVISMGNALSIIALQQRASGGVSGTQFQIQGNNILGEDYLVADGIKEIENLSTALQQQNDAYQDDVTSSEEQIGLLSVALESEKFAIQQLTQERDLAKHAYIALANQLEETRITQAQEERSAKISASAMIPKKSHEPNVYTNSGLAGILGLMVSVAGAFLYEWWTTSDE